jgi:beta-glucosidase
MGATFDAPLLNKVGGEIAKEAKRKGIHIVNAPTVCIQRSPLLGRGFEAFTEDPFLSGSLASSFINGMQDLRIGSCIKHYAAHDQSLDSTEDDIVATERTLREVHMLPFQLAVKNAKPWAFMTAYNRINGTHASENKWLIDDVLRRDWGWDGLVMSDWSGVYSCASAINAGLDLEMPGPPKWRGSLLEHAINCGKVSVETLNTRVRNVLKLIAKIKHDKAASDRLVEDDTPEGRALCRKVAADSIVLLKNIGSKLPLNTSASQTYGLIGDHWMHPSASGGGSSDLTPYYVSNPMEAFKEAVGQDKVEYEPGCNCRFSIPPFFL